MAIRPSIAIAHFKAPKPLKHKAKARQSPHFPSHNATYTLLHLKRSLATNATMPQFHQCLCAISIINPVRC